MRSKWLWPFVVALSLTSGASSAQQAVTTGRTTYQGTLSLTANTVTTLTAANVTMSPGSGALPQPGGFARLVIIAPASSCNFTVDWIGGAATATAGEQFGAGTSVGSDTVDLTGNQKAPTLFSAAGCSSPNLVQFHN